MTRVFVVASSDLLRAGLVALASRDADLTVVGEAAGFESEPSFTSADVILLAADSVPERADFDEAEGSPPIVLLTDVGQPGFPRNERGGLLPRSASAGAIVAALKAAAHGLTVIDPLMIEGSRWDTSRKTPLDGDSPLTTREIEVLRMIAEGAANKEIAYRLGISEHTVKFHISSILSKLNASSRTEAVTLGARLGLVFL